MKTSSYIYIITNYKNTTLYTGVTSNLVKRIWEHKNEIVEGFSKKYKLHKLVYYEVIDNIETAINREKYIKGKSRQYKINLIESINKEWKDLYDDITSSNYGTFHTYNVVPPYFHNGVMHILAEEKPEVVWKLKTKDNE